MLGEQRPNQALVAYVAPHESEVGVGADMCKRYLLKEEVVDYRDVVTASQQLGHENRADITGAASDQDGWRGIHAAAWPPSAAFPVEDIMQPFDLRRQVNRRIADEKAMVMGHEGVLHFADDIVVVMPHHIVAQDA